jgi:hypothetical protein
MPARAIVDSAFHVHTGLGLLIDFNVLRIKESSRRIAL